MDDRRRQQIGAFLRQGEWFGGLPDALQDTILRHGALRTYSRNQFVQREDRPSLGLFAVLEGQVSLLRHVGDDDPALIHVAAPGFWFGEFGILTGDAAVTAVAMTSVQTFLLPKAAFDRIIDEEPRYYPPFARIVLARVHILVRYLAESLRLSPDHRLRLRLADLADTKRAQTTSDGPAVLLDMSQSELAEIIGLSRQKLNRRLKCLEEEGWVELAPRRIRVLDAGGLRATAAGSLARER
jgi:CRP/FNR family transcriptional regulator, cyclic AMP receptor protein